MERIDQFNRAHAQPHMGAAITVDRRHGRTQIQPKFGIGLAEADGARPNDQLFVADGAQHRLIEARRPVEIAHRNGDVIDHCRTILVPPDAMEHAPANLM
jgi:hypothetical protein